MSIADKIQRLQAAKAAIATAITGKGGTVNSGDGYEDFADDIATIPADGGALDLQKGYKFAYATFRTMPDELANANWDMLRTANFMFYQASSLTQTSAKELTLCRDISYMFYNCVSLTTLNFTFPTNITGCSCAFFGCTKLEHHPILHTPTCIDFTSMFQNCGKLLSVDLDTANGTSFTSMLNGCTALTSVKLNFTKASSLPQTVFGSSTMPNLTEIVLTGSLNVTAYFNRSPNLTFESIKSILTAAAATTNTNAKTLTLANTIADRNGELAALKAQCQSKGWTITGLTIN